VHVALWTREAGLVAGAVALPARDAVLATDTVRAVDSSRCREILAGERPIRIAVSRTRPPVVVQALSVRDDVEVVPLGSTGVKVAAVIEGDADAYVHAGGQYEWDSAAPVAVARAAALVATRLDGSPLVYNRPEPWCPDLLVCHAAIERRLRDLLRAGAEAAG
jgi:3'(2'), 5'-bisphosphate nucleotidase